MEPTRQFVLLGFGLCLVFYYVHAANVRVLGSGFFSRNDDMSWELTNMMRQQAKLKAEVAHATGVDKFYREMELQSVTASLAQLKASLRVPYTDYLASLSGQRKDFEWEKAQLRKKLADAENRRLQAVDALKLQGQKNGAEVATYQAALTEETTKRNKIANEYAKFMEAYYKQEEKMKQERDQLLTEKEKLQQTIDGAKKKHSQVLEALSATPTEGYSTIRIPEQAEINKLREDITTFNGMADRKKLKEGLETTKTKLVELLDKLYKAGKFSSKATREDIESALGEMETNTLAKREDQQNQRKSLVDKLKNEDLNNYDDTEIASLKKANEEIIAADLLQKEIARRSAYLKAIVDVSDLIQECSNAIRDANERNLANLWVEAIQEAADSPLGKQWTKALQEAKDSELAKVWADTIQEAKNSKLAQAWTSAIEEAKDINVAEIWNDAVQNLKNSPLAKLWTDTIKNAKDSPFTKECANVLQSAKNSLCEVVSMLK